MARGRGEEERGGIEGSRRQGRQREGIGKREVERGRCRRKKSRKGRRARTSSGCEGV